MRWRSATTCNLIRLWVAKYEHGAFEDDVRAADLLQEYETKIAALERWVGRQALDIEFLRGASRSTPRPRSATTSLIAGLATLRARLPEPAQFEDHHARQRVKTAA
jgi:transposase